MSLPIGEGFESNLPPRMAMYKRVARAKMSLEDEIYSEAERSLMESDTIGPDVKLRIPEQARIVRQYGILNFLPGEGPEVNLEDRPMMISLITPTGGARQVYEDPQDIFFIILVDPAFINSHGLSKFDNSVEVLLHPEMPPTMVDFSEYAEICVRNGGLSVAGQLNALKEVNPAKKRELTDDECEAITSAFENFEPHDSNIDEVKGLIHEYFFRDDV